MLTDIDDKFDRIRSWLTLMLTMFYLVNLPIRSVWLNELIFLLLILAIIFSLPAVSGSTKVIGYISYGLSIVIFLYYRAPFSVWEQAFEENLYIVVLFAVVPLLKIPIQHGGYFEALQGVFRRFIFTPGRFYLLVSFISAFIGTLVNLAVVPLVHEISRASDLSANKKLLCAAISRGFTTCSLWAPTMAAIAMVIQLTGIEWYLFFPFGILNGIIAGVTGYILTMVEEKDSGVRAKGLVRESALKINYYKVVELSLFGVVLIVCIAVISMLTGIPSITVVSFASIIFPALWLSFLRKLPVLLREFKGDYFHRSLPSLKNEIVLFIGAGLFTASISYSHLGVYVQRVLSVVVGDNALLFTVAVLLASLLFSGVGVHPLVTIVVIGGTVNASAYGVTPIYLATVLTICWGLGVAISPSAANIIAVAGLVEESPVQVGIVWNGKYVIITSIILILTATALRLTGVL